VDAYEDMKQGRSVVTDTLQNLANQAKLCRERIDLLEAGQKLNRGEVVADLGKLLDACQDLRDAILSEDSAASWSTKQELHALVNRLDDAAAKRRQYLDLAQFLANGTVSHRRERTRQERLALRDAAVAELMEISERAAPPALPGPAVEEWLVWACGLEDGADEPDLLNLKNNFPRLDDFVRQLEIEWWHDGPAAAPVHHNGSNPTALPTSDTGSTTSDFAEKAETVSQSAAVSVMEPDPVEIETPEIEEEEEVIEEASQLPDALPTASDQVEVVSQVENRSMDSVSSLTDTILSGKVSFFSWNDVDNFSRHIELSKTQLKEDRKIRALVATSHWLQPSHQNPAFHPSCGIRALTGYAGTSDLEVVSSEDAMSAVATDHRLDLFIGGADLLRWGLLQPFENQFNGVASVRRLRFDQLKAWFGEIFKIELADQQFRDIYTLSSGIPILVGELHRLIIPVPEEPPRWIGHAPWMEIKLRFEDRLPIIAQELKKGVPSVRLTDREIELLKMVVIASDDSSIETFASNLTSNWQSYNRRDLRALGSRDEASVALLQDLGLLPMQRASGLERIKALLPVERGDAIRAIVKHL